MKGVVLAAGEGTRLRPLTDEQPKGLVEVAGQPLLTHCFETLLSVGVAELVVVVGYRAADVMARYGDEYGGAPITYVHQRERLGLAHAVSQVEPHVESDFVVLNGDNVCEANLGAVLDRHRETGADATVLIDEVSAAEARETGVFEFADRDAGTDAEGAESGGDADGIDPDRREVVGMVEKPDDPPSTSVPRGFFAFSPRIFHACHLVQPSARGEYELTDAVDLLLAADRSVETVPLEGWCVNVNEPADRERVADRLA